MTTQRTSADNNAEQLAATPTPNRRRSVIGWFMRAVRTVLIAYLVVILAMLWLEDSLLYFPAPYPAGDWQPVGVDFEEAVFEAADGTQLHGWYLDHERPRAVLLYAHGNAGNLTHRIGVAQRLNRDLDLAVLIFDYRGYGKSEGNPSEEGVVADARAARDWLAHRTGVTADGIVLMGRSLGGGVAVDLAAKDGARALVLESTFTSLPDVAAGQYPWLPVRSLMRNQFASAAIIEQYHGPLLQSHGTADGTIPYEIGRTLFAAANEPKLFVDIPGGDHNAPQPEAYYRKLNTFLDRLSADE